MSRHSPLGEWRLFFCVQHEGMLYRHSLPRFHLAALIKTKFEGACPQTSLCSNGFKFRFSLRCKFQRDSLCLAFSRILSHLRSTIVLRKCWETPSGLIVGKSYCLYFKMFFFVLIGTGRINLEVPNSSPFVTKFSFRCLSSSILPQRVNSLLLPRPPTQCPVSYTHLTLPTKA